MHRIYLLLIFLLQIFSLNAQELKLASIFTDGAVFQQESVVKLWGKSAPLQIVSIMPSWREAITVTSDSNGDWCALLKTLKAGYKSYSVKIEAGNEIIKLEDIVFGEVWIISGQSNMEMSFYEDKISPNRVNGSNEVINGKDDDFLRSFNVARKESFYPQENVVLNGGWKKKNHENVVWFSAVGYFFAAKLREHLDIPVGIINSSYGGSPIESWIPEEYTVGQIYSSKSEERREEIRMNALGQNEALKRFGKWIKESQKFSGQELAESDFSNLDKLSLPNYFYNTPRGESLGGTFLYKKIDIAKPSELILELPMIDRNCEIYFNGKQIYQNILPSQAYRHPQVTIPSEIVQNGENVIAINLISSLWNGGIVGRPEEMRIASSDTAISLAGEWHFKKTFELSQVAPAPKEGLPNAFLLSSLYNGVIYPLARYPIRGFLWYQGESNVGNAGQYPEMLKNMVKGWRDIWGKNLPFYYVQIAPYKYSGHKNTEAAEMRVLMSEACKRIPNSGVILTVDLGEPENIHPPKKREVGQRLAFKALSETYKHSEFRIDYPEVSDAKIVDGVVTLKFRNTYGKLISLSDSSAFELSEDDKTYYKSNFKIVGDEVFIFNNSIKNPKFVRHAFRNSSTATIGNAEMLPINTFKIDL
ncbi:MAG: sialate O-acetylesterase [Bacteroidales bacterium]